MEQGKRQIELRSEKVRNLIGQVPPLLVRDGSLIIGIALLVMVGVSAFIPYQPSINVEINVAQTDDGMLHYSTHIPQSAMKSKAKFTEVTLNTPIELTLPTRFEIKAIFDVVELSEKNAWQTATLQPTEKISSIVLLDKPLVLQGSILLEKQSVMRWVMSKIAL